jgi:glycosyltransferase involved in cell wall biosynthesis
MRIGINASFLRKPGTGIGQVTTYLLEHLSAHAGGSDTFVVYTEEPTSLSLSQNFEERSFLPFWKRDDLLRKWLWERKLAHEAKKDHCDVLLSTYQSTTVSSLPHTMIVHDLIPRLFPEYQGNVRQKWYWKQIEKALLQADKIVAVSEATRNDLVEFGVAHEKIVIASPDAAPIFSEPIALEEENRVMAQYNLVPGYIYHGGGLEIRKNTEGVLRAYKMLCEKEERGELQETLPPLVISGKIFSENNPLATPVHTLVRELGLSERVKLLDFVPEYDLPALYKNALFFVYPSKYEGFGLPVLEALAMSTPVLTSDVSSLPEVAGDAALYIDPLSIPSLVSGMERLLKDTQLRMTLSEKAKEVRQRFSWSHMAQTVYSLLEKQTH